MAKSHEARCWPHEYGKEYIISEVISCVSKAWKAFLSVHLVTIDLGIDYKEIFMCTKTSIYGCLFSVTANTEKLQFQNQKVVT